MKNIPVNEKTLLMSASCRKLIAYVLLFPFLTNFAVSAYAATNLSDSPIPVAASTSTVRPNVLFTIDSSGGMDVDVLLPTYNSMYYEQGVTVNTSVLNGNFYLFPLPNHPSWMSVMLEGDSSSPDPAHWRARNYQYNPQFYNPSKTYMPWPGVDDVGVAFGNASATAVRLDPYQSSGYTFDLTRPITYNAHTYLSPGGTDITGSSPPGRYYSSTLFPAMYYVWNDANGNGVMDASEGVRYEIKPATPSYPSGRTYAQELQNFANWFQYYRTVMLSLKAAVGTQAGLLGNLRMGMTDLEHNSVVSPVADMSVSANLASFRAKVYGINPNLADWRQPVHERVYSANQYFSQTGSSAPVQYACQQNFHVLVTPGYLNENGGSAPGFKNYFTGVTPPAIPTPNYDGTAGAPYSDSFSDTLADWVAYYYDQNVRPDLTLGQVPIPSGTQETNRNPHVTTFTLAPGAIPYLQSNSPYLNPSSTVMFPPAPASPPVIPWPNPTFVAQTTIDDLWHAAINGKGEFVNDPDVAGGLSAVLNNIANRGIAFSASAVSNPNISPTDSVTYGSSFDPATWTGEIQAYNVNLTTAVVSTTSNWSTNTQARIDAKTTASSDTRIIATFNGSAGIPFQWSSLTASQQGRLNSNTTPPGPSDGQTVLQFLRGWRGNEATLYRRRTHLLGDIVNAEGVVVSRALFNYSDAGYSSFATTGLPSTRSKMLYQGANDGMLHAIDAATGDEKWAYIPGLLINSSLPGATTTSALVNLTRKSGFVHQYYIDATPVVADAYIGTSGSTASRWRTLLVGGLGKGGRGFFALDVTDPTATSEISLASKALWEVTDADMGYSYGKPVVVKTRAAGWVVLVTSGYNNVPASNGGAPGSTTGDGKGYLYVFNAATGAQIAKLSTGSGTVAAPSGLAQISAFVEDTDIDNTVDLVYGGDLNGDVWRFDLTGATSSGWTVSKLATLKDAAGVSQPITTAPETGWIYSPGKYRMVFVGTGKYLGTPDVNVPPEVDSMYGLKDAGGLVMNSGSAAATITGRGSLVGQTLTLDAGGLTRTISHNAVVLASSNGWYIDLPGSVGERINADPQLAYGVLVFTSNIPDPSPCSIFGGSSWINFVDYKTGGAVKLASGLYYRGSEKLGNTLASRPTIVEAGGKLHIIGRKTDDTPFTVEPPMPSAAKRVFWRELGD